MMPGGTGGRQSPEDPSPWKFDTQQLPMPSPSPTPRRPSFRRPVAPVAAPAGPAFLHPMQEDNVVEPPKNLDHIAGEPEGYRLVDMRNLVAWLKSNVSCKRCAEDRATNILAEFADFCAEKRIEGVHVALQDFHKAVHAKKSTASKVHEVAGIEITEETCQGWKSTFQVHCLRRDSRYTERCHVLGTLSTSNDIEQRADGTTFNFKTPEVNARMTDAFMEFGRGAHDWLWMAAKLNMPLSTNNYKDIFAAGQRCIARAALPLAEDSCKEVCEKARKLSWLYGNTPAILATRLPFLGLQNKEVYPMSIGGDAGWCERSSGHKYESNAGVFTATWQPPVGFVPQSAEQRQLAIECTHKVLAYQTLQKDCFECQRLRSAQRKKNPDEEPVISEKRKKAHMCQENHHGLHSKSMEWRGAVMCDEWMVKTCNIFIAELCSDDDSTMKKHLRDDMPEPVRLQTSTADHSHRTRTFGSRVYGLLDKKITGEVAGDSRFSKKCAAKCKQYHGLVQAARGKCLNPTVDLYSTHMMAMLHHLFDDHTKGCGQLFECKALVARARGDDYVPDIKHKVLNERLQAVTATEGRRYLSGDKLFGKLKSIFEEFCTEQKCRESMHQQSTQFNEAMNKKYWSKAPKDRDFSGSVSFSTRVALCVGEANWGHVDFHVRLAATLNMNAGVWTMKALRYIAAIRSKDQAMKTKLETKAKRKYARVLTSKEAYAQGHLDYSSKSYLHEGVSCDDQVRAALNAAIAKVERVVQGEAVDVEATAKLAPAKRGGKRAKPAGLACRTCGLVTDPPHSRSSSRLCAKNKKNRATAVVVVEPQKSN
eukprot:SAG11_NODE_83_length_17378_cov_5.388622_6_plen_820_part_00